MRRIAAICAGFLLVWPMDVLAECFDAASSGAETYLLAARAINETSLAGGRNYARNAKDAADDAESAAEDCDCDDAASRFDDAYSYALRASNADNMAELMGYAGRAMRAAETGNDALESCR